MQRVRVEKEKYDAIVYFSGFLFLTAFASGGNDNAQEEATPETTEMAGGPYLAHDEFVNLLKEEVMK